MAQLLINPHVEDFFEIVSGTGTTLDLAEIRVTANSTCANRVLSETDFRKRGVIVVAIRRPDGGILLPPSASTRFDPDDVLIALGKVSAVSSLELLAQQEASPSDALSANTCHIVRRGRRVLSLLSVSRR